MCSSFIRVAMAVIVLHLCFLNNSEKSLPFASLQRLSERPYPETDRSDRTINHGLQMGLPVYFHLAEDRGWQNSRRAPAVPWSDRTGSLETHTEPQHRVRSEWLTAFRQTAETRVCGAWKNQMGMPRKKVLKYLVKGSFVFVWCWGSNPGPYGCILDVEN